MRVLHAPINIGNQPYMLSRCERELGIRSDLVTMTESRLAFDGDKERVLFRPGTPRWLGKARWLATSLTAPLRYDVLHYSFGRTLMSGLDPRFRKEWWYKDLRIAKRLGRRLVMTLNGCDARLARQVNARFSVKACAPGACSSYGACVGALDSRTPWPPELGALRPGNDLVVPADVRAFDDARRWLIDEVLPMFDRVFYAALDLGNFVPGAELLPIAAVDVRSIEPAPPRPDARPRIVHAPTDTGIKGTPIIEEVLQRLGTRHDFEYVRVQGVPHSEAMEIYRSADLVIDQILIGNYGGLAVEVMAMGKPVVVYMRPEDLRFMPEAMRDELPVLNATPDDLEAVVDRFLTDRSSWQAISEASRQFALRWHDPRRIAKSLVAIYRDPRAPLVLGDAEAT